MSDNGLMIRPSEITLAGFTLNKTGLVAEGSPSYEDWQHVGDYIHHVDGAVHFWIGDWANYGEKSYGDKYTDAVDKTGFEYGTIANDKYVSGQIEFSRRRENLTFCHHQAVAALPPKTQDKFLTRAEKEKWTSKHLRQKVQDYRAETAKLTAGQIPAGTYRLILADPPWQYDFSETNSRKIENQYPTMTVEQIQAISIPCAPDCILLLWATAPKLREALSVIESWGFEYKTCATWDKEKIGMGYWFRGQHELLLLATRGAVSPPEPENLWSSVLREKRGKHSEKPESAYRMIDSMFPNFKKKDRVELFSRAPRENWSSWGNEA